jgi:hypothetical protein
MRYLRRRKENENDSVQCLLPKIEHQKKR